MDNLTVKELQSICRAFNLPYASLRKEQLIDLVNLQLGNIQNPCVQIEGESDEMLPAAANETPTRWARYRVSVIGFGINIKNRLFRPLRRIYTVIPNQNPSQNITTLPRINNWLFQIGALFGFIGGMNTLYQAAMYYFGEPETIEVLIRRG